MIHSIKLRCEIGWHRMIAATVEYKTDQWWYWFFYESDRDPHGPFATFKEATIDANDKWCIERMPSDLVM